MEQTHIKKVLLTNDNKTIKFSNKETLFYNMIHKFYKSTNKNNIEYMIDIINGNSKISLRLLDWFVTRYAKKHKVSYHMNDERFNVHISYKAQLKSYKKRYFDPFRRRKKFNYVYDKENNKKIYTTIGQLNFFRWAFRYGILTYVEDHYKTISDAMKKSNKEDDIRKQLKKKNSSDSSTSIKKNNVRVKAKKHVDNNVATIILTFD